MRRVFQVVCFLCICVGVVAPANGYDITKVIEVGRGSGGIVGTPKWSPDGTKLAYFRDTVLCISDTLGSSRDIAALQLYPRKCQWLSNDEVVVSLWSGGGRVDKHALVSVDINTSEITVLGEFTRDIENGSPYLESVGDPELTIEGNCYYRTNVVRRRDSGPMGIRFPQSKYGGTDSALALERNHILQWGEDCLYMMSGDLRDTLRLGPKPYRNMLFEPVLRSDRAFYVVGGTLYRFQDSTFLSLGTFLKDRPTGTVVTGFLDPSFNPKFEEVLFTVACEDSDTWEVIRIGTFDLRTSQLRVVDEVNGRKDLEQPSYAPDGLKIAVVADGVVCILYREGLKL